MHTQPCGTEYSFNSDCAPYGIGFISKTYAQKGAPYGIGFHECFLPSAPWLALKFQHKQTKTLIDSFYFIDTSFNQTIKIQKISRKYELFANVFP